MKRISVREAQHHLASVLALVESGEEVEITRRNVVVAFLVPAKNRAGATEKARRANFADRLRQLYPAGPYPAAPGAEEVGHGRR